MDIHGYPWISMDIHSELINQLLTNQLAGALKVFLLARTPVSQGSYLGQSGIINNHSGATEIIKDHLCWHSGLIWTRPKQKKRKIRKYQLFSFPRWLISMMPPEICQKTQAASGAFSTYSSPVSPLTKNQKSVCMDFRDFQAKMGQLGTC